MWGRREMHEKFLIRHSEGKRLLGRHKYRWRVILKWTLKKRSKM
jgi:hypothetical protein